MNSHPAEVESQPTGLTQLRANLVIHINRFGFGYISHLFTGYIWFGFIRFIRVQISKAKAREGGGGGQFGQGGLGFELEGSREAAEGTRGHVVEERGERS